MIENREWRIIQAQLDMQHALSALTFFDDIPEKITFIEKRRFRCYHDSAVVYYSRPFTDSKGTPKGLPKLKLSDIGIRPDAAEKKLHSRLMAYRNKVAAHTDADRMRVLFTTFEMSGAIRLPHIVSDEGFEFLDDCRQLEAWFRKILFALANFVFELAQKIPLDVKYLRDYLSAGE